MSVLTKRSSTALLQFFRLELPSPKRLLRMIAAADARYRDKCYLQELDERTLRDVGISRAEIAAELRGLR